MTKINIEIRETVDYGGEFELEELEEATGFSLADDYEGDLNAFMDDLRDNLESTVAGTKFLEDLEHHTGNVNGQEWTVTGG